MHVYLCTFSCTLFFFCFFFLRWWVFFFLFFSIPLQLDSLLCVCRFVYEWVFGCMCWDACMCVWISILYVCVCICVHIYICLYIYVYIYMCVYMYTISFLFFFNIKSKIIIWIIIGGQLDEIVFFLVAFDIAINLIFLLFILFKLIVYAVSEINTTTTLLISSEPHIHTAAC